MKMTNEQIKEVLDAFDEGKEIEFYSPTSGEWTKDTDIDSDCKEDLLCALAQGYKYRVKPEPKKIELYTSIEETFEFEACSIFKCKNDTHKLTYLLDENNEPICESVKLEKL